MQKSRKSEKNKPGWIFKVLFLLLLLNSFSINCFARPKISCIIETELGSIRIKLYPEQAPITVANFLSYIDRSLYDRTNFYRVCTPENERDREIRIQVIQGGDVRESDQQQAIRLETTKTTGLRHRNGTLSMARGEPDSATSSFFICIGNQPELDFSGKRNPDGQGFAAFGRVTRGMKVVRKIQHEQEIRQFLINPVRIDSIRRL